jgi:hypothetical protein
MYHNRISCLDYCSTFTVKKESPNFFRRLYFSKKLPKENNRPISENSPILVTLYGNEGSSLAYSQGNQIGRIVAFWAIVFIGYIIGNYRSTASSLATFFHETSHVSILTKTGWATLWAIFTQTHLVALLKASADFVHSKQTFEKGSAVDQGCQIFLGTKYQNGGKYTK